jgi:hypothetical protein
MADQPEQIQIQAEWLDASELIPIFANVFAVQPVKNEFILTFGCATPPIFSKPLTVDEARRMKIKIKPSVRIGMTPDRIIEFIQLLQTQLKAYSDTELKN